MKKITQIQLSNYRAFYNGKNETAHTINLPNGENLLVYGENGSGKSSLFHALQDFFMSAKGNVDFANKINLFAKGKGTDFPHSEIQVYFKEKEREEWKPMHEKEDEEGEMQPIPLIFSENLTTKDNVIENASQAFLSYRDMLKTYFLDNDKQESPNLFELFVANLLRKVTSEIDNNKIEESLVEIDGVVKNLEVDIQKVIRLQKEAEEDYDEHTIRDEEEAKVKSLIEQFNIALETHLTPIFEEINTFLKAREEGGYFNANFKLKLDNKFPFLSIEKGELKKQLRFEVEYFGQKIDNTAYHHFLNEARLSALAICIYLVAIKKDKPTKDNYKILFLDDIFIGLDMSNRLPLLEILKNEFADYQIFMTTYDRAWFEVAKKWLENKTKENWKFFEMYVDDFTNQFDVPVVLETKDLLTKAFFHEKEFDYPASANYLRKAVEELLDKKFKGEYNLILKGNDGLDLGELDR
ncbi:MAG: ATP-binding cassette domain-containing protein [Thermoflexibacteraceae bacterium]